jgi:SAM-dependent methyltransferase
VRIVDEEHLAANRANWDDRVPVHLASQLYDVDGWLADAPGPRSEEFALLGDLAGLGVVHLQCHIGTDTLALARAGATVTGLDVSPASIAAARDLAARAGLAQRATFVEADVHRAVEVLGAGRFDLVYVSLGSLCWLPSVDRWAEQAVALLRPGGRLYLHDTHPLNWALGDGELRIEETYFERGEPFVSDSEVTYTDGDGRLDHQRTYQWNHSIGEVVSALLARGMVLDALHEHPWTDFPRFPFLRVDERGRWAFPVDMPAVPLSFTVLAHLQP